MEASGGILVIEDDADVARSARLALSPQFARIELATSPLDLEERLATSAIDAVLLDMNFVSAEHGGGAGLNALARIQTVDSTLAVVLMTAYGGVALAVESLKRGAVDFILKPWSNDKLIAAVTAARAITQARRDNETIQLNALERGAIERALNRHAGNVSLAAADLGLSRPALYRRMSKHGL
jgi:two-component system, response regulator RegA